MLIPILGNHRSLLPPTHTDGTGPLGWYDAQDINLKRNFGVVDGSQPLTVKNKGTKGTAWDVTQATTGLRFTFRKVASAGLLKNHSGLESAGGQGMASASFALQNQPLTVAFVVRSNAVGTVVLYSGSAANRTQIYYIGTGVNIYNGNNASPAMAITANKFQTIGQVANGVSTTFTLDGVTSGALATAGTQGHDKVTLMCADAPPANSVTGMFIEGLFYGALAPSMATIAAYYAARHGATPQ